MRHKQETASQLVNRGRGTNHTTSSTSESPGGFLFSPISNLLGGIGCAIKSRSAAINERFDVWNCCDNSRVEGLTFCARYIIFATKKRANCVCSPVPNSTAGRLSPISSSASPRSLVSPRPNLRRPKNYPTSNTYRAKASPRMDVIGVGEADVPVRISNGRVDRRPCLPHKPLRKSKIWD